MLTGQEELEKILSRSTRGFDAALQKLASLSLHPGSLPYRNAFDELQELIGATLIIGNLLGRKRTLMEADKARRGGKFDRVDVSPIVPDVPFVEAIDRIVAAEPRLAANAEEVATLYSTQKVFALTRSCADKVTKRVQEAMAKWVLDGSTADEARNAIEQIGTSELAGDVRNWTAAYADTVYATNASTAYNEGRFAQASAPGVADVMAGFELVCVPGPYHRDNHEAANGMVAAASDPVWAIWRPPNGFKCMCGINFVSRYSAERRGLIRDGKFVPYYPAGLRGAQPDAGFQQKRQDF